MSNIIESLTAEQERLLDVWADKWTAIGLNCDKTDFELGMKAVDRMYEVAGLKAPRQVMVCESPLALVTGKGMRTLRGRAKAVAAPDLSQAYYGQFTAGWAGFYDYMREALGLREETEELVGGLLEAPKHLGWCLFYEERAYLSAKTTAIRMNTAGGLHSVDLPAVEYGDGFAIYAVNDVVVPDEWVLNKSALDPKIALEWPNVEQRAVAGQIIGWDRVLQHVGAKTIDANPNAYIGTLLEAVIAGTRRRFLEVRCATGRTMVLSVDPNLETAAAANDWSFGDDSGLPDEGRT